MERLSGGTPVKRQYSVPEIARRVGVPLAQLKRVIRGQDEASPALLVKLAKDLDMPLRELRAVADEVRSQTGPTKTSSHFLSADDDDPYRVLEEGLIASARALVQLLRSRVEPGSGNRDR